MRPGWRTFAWSPDATIQELSQVIFPIHALSPTLGVTEGAAVRP